MPQPLGPAIAIMTNWVSTPDDQRADATAAQMLAHVEASPADAVGSLAMLAAVLLGRVEYATGVSPAETLRDIATRYDDL